MISEEQIAEACNKAYFQVGHNAYFGNGFTAGVKFAEQHYQSEKAELIKNIDELCEDLAHNESHEVRTFLRKIDELLTKNQNQ